MSTPLTRNSNHVRVAVSLEVEWQGTRKSAKQPKVRSKEKVKIIVEGNRLSSIGEALKSIGVHQEHVGQAHFDGQRTSCAFTKRGPLTLGDCTALHKTLKAGIEVIQGG